MANQINIIYREDQRDWGHSSKDHGYLVGDQINEVANCPLRIEGKGFGCDECRAGGACSAEEHHRYCVIHSGTEEELDQIG